MSQELVFYTHPMSRGRIARWMLEETGADYRVEALSYGDTMKAAPYLAVNPMGKVPALVHGDAVVTEAAAICAYLCGCPHRLGHEHDGHHREAAGVRGVLRARERP